MNKQRAKSRNGAHAVPAVLYIIDCIPTGSLSPEAAEMVAKKILFSLSWVPYGPLWIPEGPWGPRPPQILSVYRFRHGESDFAGPGTPPKPQITVGNHQKR